MDRKQKRIVKDIDLYREKIIEMIPEVKDEKFLKRIYISIRDYISEK